MIRISEIRLPLAALPSDPETHPVAELQAAAAQALGIAPADITHIHVFKRSFDARKAALLAVYIVDVTLAEPEQEAPLLSRHSTNPHIQPTPDMAWHPVGEAPADLPLRPVVVEPIRRLAPRQSRRPPPLLVFSPLVACPLRKTSRR